MNDQVQYSEARNKAIAHIGISVSSSGKIREYLCNNGYDRDLIEEVISQLIEDGYVDDARVARKILRQRSGSKAEGRAKFSLRLEASGIPHDVIDEVLSEDEFSDEKTIMEVIHDRFPVESFSSDPSQSQRELAKAIRYLESRGYSASLALASFRKLIHDVE